MKTYGSIWAKVIDAENLTAAWCRVRRNHARSAEVAEFADNLNENLGLLRQNLLSGNYSPQGYRQFKIWDPKPRIISCAPVRDRIVHHALCDQIAPLVERGFIADSFACRKGKGMHRACVRAQELSRRNRYALKIDIHHCFDSIDHQLLKSVVCAHFREKAVRQLISTIIDTYATEKDVGLPIGNLTSQWFANDFLNELDHRITERHGLSLVRYMDDMLIFAPTKAACWRIYDEIVRYLAMERKLRLKESATLVVPVEEGIPFLGLRIYPDMLRLQHKRLWRTRRHQHVREREFLEGRISARQLVASVRSMDGCVRWFGMRNILLHDLNQKILAAEEWAASGSNRQNRGGSWNNDAGNATSSYRNNNNPSNTNNNLGFRLFSTLIKATLSNSAQPVPDAVGTNNASSLSSSRRELANRRQLLFSFMGDEG